MQRLYSGSFTRFHISGSARYPTGRLVELVESDTLAGSFYADLEDDEAEILTTPPADGGSNLLQLNGWSLTPADQIDRAEAAILKAREKAAANDAKASKPAGPEGTAEA